VTHLGDPKAVLCATPRNLYFFWEEWASGLNGNKPASQFTREERGVKTTKYKFHQRKFVWDAVGNLVQASVSSNAAIDRIYAMFGRNQSVTHIINKMKEDKAN
jgi:hypothetical protein